MKILYIHNDYHKPSGEEHASGEICSMLESHGHEVRWFKKSTKGIEDNLGMKVRSFYQGIYRPSIQKEIAPILDEYKPDVVMVQNLYPFISSAVFRPIKERKIPVIMRCPNYRLFCPGGLSLNPKGEVCEKCWSGIGEWHCVFNNCQQSMAKSIGYAARNAFNRITGKIRNSVDCFIVQSQFQKNKFIGQGIPADHIGILAGILPEVGEIEERPLGKWVSFVGRVSAEKGIYEFIEAAKALPEIPFKVAGNLDENFHIPADCPKNVEFVGFKKGDELNRFYQDSRIIVVPSKWYEGFPNVILRAMLLDRPVITTNIGAMQSIIDSGENGLLVEPASVEDLRKAIASLYPDEELCLKYGRNGHEKANRVYSREQIYDDLMKIISIAQQNNK